MEELATNEYTQADSIVSSVVGTKKAQISKRANVHASCMTAVCLSRHTVCRDHFYSQRTIMSYALGVTGERSKSSQLKIAEP